MGWSVLSVWIQLNKFNKEVSCTPFCSEYVSGITCKWSFELISNKILHLTKRDFRVHTQSFDSLRILCSNDHTRGGFSPWNSCFRVSRPRISAARWSSHHLSSNKTSVSPAMLASLRAFAGITNVSGPHLLNSWFFKCNNFVHFFLSLGFWVLDESYSKTI